MMSLGLIIESLVAILLVLTIVYCMVLNARLKRLRSDEEAMRATISELITATEIAERAILGLRSTANDCDETLSVRLEEAAGLCVTLKDQIESGDEVVNRLAQITQAAHHVPQHGANHGVEPAAALARMARGHAAQAQPASVQPQPRSQPQSQAPIPQVTAPHVMAPQPHVQAQPQTMTPHMLLKAAEQSADRLRSMRGANGVAA